MLAAELGSARVTQVGSVLKAWRSHGEQLSPGAVWQGWGPREEAGEAAGKGADSVALGA